MVTLGEKVLPQNIEAEKAVLGSMLIEKEATAKAVEILQKKSFYKESHQKIFQVIVDLYDRDEAVDIVIIAEELKKSGNSLSNVGGAQYLTSLINSVSTAANVEYYAKIVREKAILRELINVSTRIITESYEGEEDVGSLLDKAEQYIFNIAQAKLTQGFIPVSEMVHDSIELIENLYKKKEHITGVPTGFCDFDEKTGGLHSSNLIIIAGRPSMGKTSFALSIAQYAAIEKKMPVAIFSLEMSKEEVLMRMLCSEAKVNLHHVRTGFLSKKGWPALTSAASRLSEAPIYIDDAPAPTVLEMKARARRLKAEKGLALLIIDYLQLMPGRTGKAEYRQQDVSEITRALKILAKELNVPVVALSQLSRAPEKRTEPRPQLADLRESGAIEQDADVVAFIYREEYYKPNQPDLEGKAELIVGKQRNGPTGTIPLTFQKEHARFNNFSKRAG